METNLNTRKIVFLLIALLSAMPFISTPIALLMGLILAQIIEHPFLHLNQKATQLLLKISVVGLGFGMNVFSAIKAGKEGLIFTVCSIIGVLSVGYLLGKLFKTGKSTSFLISAGTAICGGSAIAALSPVMKAKEKDISVALAIVFILNSVALFIFPMIGHAFNLSQSQFGMWCAIAIHDTSSVVGAASKYGEEALQLATTVKLGRALWIVPLAFATTFLFRTDRKKVKIPYFIGLFILAMLANTYLPFIQPLSPYIVKIAKSALNLTLFLIGTGLSFQTMKVAGVKPFLQGLILWIAISSLSLWAIIAFV